MKYFEATLYVSQPNQEVTSIAQSHGFGWNGVYFQARSKEQGYLRQLMHDCRKDLGTFGYTVFRQRLLGVLDEQTFKDPA